MTWAAGCAGALRLPQEGRHAHGRGLFEGAFSSVGLNLASLQLVAWIGGLGISTPVPFENAWGSCSYALTSKPPEQLIYGQSTNKHMYGVP